MEEFLAIDIGASSGRHILGRLQDGLLFTEEIYRFKNSPKEKGGRLIWDVDELFREILCGLKRAKELGRAPVCVGIDCFAVDYVLLKNSGERVFDVYSYRDPKTERAIKEVNASVPFEWLYGKTGIQFQPFNTLYRLKQDVIDGRLGAADKLLMLPDYLHYLLTGKESREYTNATSTGLINAQTRGWDGEILSALGLPERFFPQTQESGTKLGTFTEQIKREVGYDALVVLPATHDTASAVIGASAKDGPYLSSGTWSLLGIVQDRAHTDAESLRFNFSNEGYPDGKFRFQKNILGLWMFNRILKEECPTLTAAELTALAAEAENDERVDVQEARFFAPANMKAEIENAVGRRLTAAEAAYCALNSLAYAYAGALCEMETLLHRTFDGLNVIGGGCKNALLNGLTERYTRKKIIVGPSEATAVGNLAVQMTALGAIGNEAEIKQIIKNSMKAGVMQ